MLEMPSTIPGAGRAAMLKPTPPGRSNYIIPAGARICLYSDICVQGDQTNTDYLMVREVGGRRMMWNPLHPDGANIGRLINQGGLIEGLKALVASSDVACGLNNYSLREAEEIFKAHSNVTYKYVHQPHAPPANRHTLEVTAQRTITSSSTHAIELFGNYGIEYWMAYILRDHSHWGLEHEAVKCVMWLLLSRKSAMPQEERKKFLGQGEHTLVSKDIEETYKNMECPFPMTNKTRRRQRQ